MALSDRPTIPPPPTKGPLCTVTKLLRTLPPADAEWLAARLAEVDTWTPAALSRALRDEGFHVDQQTVARHRKGECRCDR